MAKQLNMLYFSPTGTTAKVVNGIAEGIAEGIDNRVKDHNITLPHNRQNGITFDSNDLVIVGVPVYAGRIPNLLLDYFAKVRGMNTKAVFIVVYGNRDYDDALLELKDIFERNGFIGIAGGAFVGEHSYTSQVGTGRPDRDDLETAKKFGIQIKNKCNDILQLSKLVVKGNLPYKEKHIMPLVAPYTNEKCIDCGICADNCPTAAIHFDDFKEIDSDKCILCCSCIKKCPVNAKSMNHKRINTITQSLIDNFSTIRQESQLFI